MATWDIEGFELCLTEGVRSGESPGGPEFQAYWSAMSASAPQIKNVYMRMLEYMQSIRKLPEGVKTEGPLHF